MTGTGVTSGYGLASAALSPYQTGGAAGLSALNLAVGFNRQLATTRQAQAQTAAQTANTQTATGTQTATATQTTANAQTTTGTQTGQGATATSTRQQNQVSQFKANDQAVRAEVQAQVRAAGAYGGAVTYQYQTGPDGTSYAVAGDVSFVVQPVANNPNATIAAMQVIEKAAMSVVPPSAQDLAAAREAAQYLSQAQAQLKTAQATTATTNTVLAAQQQATATAGVTVAAGLAAYATAATLAAPANQPGTRLARVA